MIYSGILVLATAGGYVASLVLLARWFSAAEATHVLPVEASQPVPHGGMQRWGIIFHAAFATGIAAALFVLEAKALALAVSWVLGVDCQDVWLPAPNCSFDAEQSRPGTGMALIVLVGCGTAGALARRLMRASVFYPPAVLMLGIVAFGSVCDTLAGGGEGGHPVIVLEVAAGLQITAALALAIGLVVLHTRTLAALIRGLAAHIAGAGVRILAALTMLSLWPGLPAASAVAVLVVAMLVPGVASALTAAAALASAKD